MNNFDHIVKLLKSSIKDPDKVEYYISEFCSCYFNSDDNLEQYEDEIIGDLAHDLEYYEPNPDYRKEDKCFFGEDVAIQKINEALKKLKR